MKQKASFLLSALALPLALSGCISFGAKPPPTLMRLTAAEARTAPASRTAAAGSVITVVVPTVAQNSGREGAGAHRRHPGRHLKAFVGRGPERFSAGCLRTIAARTGRGARSQAVHTWIRQRLSGTLERSAAGPDGGGRGL